MCCDDAGKMSRHQLRRPYQQDALGLRQGHQIGREAALGEERVGDLPGAVPLQRLCLALQVDQNVQPNRFAAPLALADEQCLVGVADRHHIDLVVVAPPVAHAFG